MTYDVCLKKTEKGKEFLTPMAIHGMSYGSEAFDWAQPFIFPDNFLTPKEVRKLGKFFHKLFVNYCKSILFKKRWNFGSDPTGVYYDREKLTPESISKFLVTKRWLDIYMTAMAFDYGIDFG